MSLKSGESTYPSSS
jgi:putative sterol carrier protein